MRQVFTIIILLNFTIYLYGQHSNTNKVKNNLINYNIPITKLVDSLKIIPANTHILILKKQYKLFVVKDTLILKSYPVVFGFNPTDDKLREGDGCTPEGKIKIRAKYPHKSWSKFIWIDYPNETSRKKHNNAVQKGIIPHDSNIGGEIGIHGVPAGADIIIDEKNNWTLGCISLKNKDIDELYNFITLDMIIEIIK